MTQPQAYGRVPALPTPWNTSKVPGVVTVLGVCHLAGDKSKGDGAGFTPAIGGGLRGRRHGQPSINFIGPGGHSVGVARGTPSDQFIRVGQRLWLMVLRTMAAVIACLQERER